MATWRSSPTRDSAWFPEIALRLALFLLLSPLGARGEGTASLPPLPVSSQTVRIRGDEVPFDGEKGVFRVVGNARAVQGRFVLTANEIEYFQREGRIVAKGRVQVSDPSFILNCNVLTYSLGSGVGVAEGLPKVTRSELPARGTDMVYTELRARIIRFRSNRPPRKGAIPGEKEPPQGQAEVEGRENVSLVRYTVSNQGMEEDFRITCKAIDAWYAQRRTVFTGDFRLKSPKNHVRARSATYYETSNRFYVQGKAEAWETDEAGRESNRIQGDMIVHDVDRGSSKVLGSIRGSFREGE